MGSGATTAKHASYHMPSFSIQVEGKPMAAQWTANPTQTELIGF